jgi:hypothetical protein
MSNPEKMNYLKSVIRGYSVFINEKINKYFSVFFTSGITIQKIKNFSPSELSNFKNILRYLIELEMDLSTDPLYLKTTLERIKTDLTFLNESLKIDSTDDGIKKEIKRLTNQKKLFELYDKVKFSNPTDSVSYASPRTKSCPEGKELNPKTGRCVKTKTQKVKIVKVKLESLEKRCPEGKELNPKTGRCVKTKTQKVKKVKTPKVKTPKVKGPKLESKVQPIICPEGCVKIETKKDEIEKTEKICPEGKELNPKTGRCIKIKTQKIKTRKQKIKE